MPSLLAAPISTTRSLASKAREIAPNVRLGMLLALLGAATISLTACDTTTPLSELDAETDRAALVALYNATGGDNWTNSDNWLSDAPIGEWYGVTTDNNGRVISLNLGGCPYFRELYRILAKTRQEQNVR